jgi:putative DNA primase/helicase
VSRPERQAMRARIADVIAQGIDSVNGADSHSPVIPAGLSMPKRAFTDLGNAERLVDRFSGVLRYNRQLGWMAWDGKRWELDAKERAIEAAKATIRTIDLEVRGLSAKQSKVFADWAVRSEARSHVHAMVDLATAEWTLSVGVDELDADPLVVNCSNGIYDVTSGELTDHDPARLLTHLAGARYRPDAGCPRFEEFLAQVQPDPVLREFLQRAAGYSVIGLASSHVLLLCFGNGANGKTTFLEALRYAFGDYSQQTPTSTLMRRKAGDASNDVARLRGARFVVATESEQDQRLAEATIKRLTGNDTLSARFLFKEYFEFEPTHTLWLATNYRPRVTGTDDGIWRRLVLIPWEVTVDPDDQDHDLPAVLRSEADGILQWALKGAGVVLTDGLKVPDRILDATLRYRQEQDILGGFLEERCVIGPELWVANADLYPAYSEWCKNAGESTILSNKAFTAEMVKRGFSRRRAEATGANRWVGIGLRAT